MEKYSLEGKNVLITGGAGFIGSNLAIALLKICAKVCCLDNLSSGRLENLKDYSEHIQIVKGDILDLDTLVSTLEGIDVVFHHAAIPSVPLSLADPVLCESVNAQGTLKVLLASLESGVKRVIYASSCALYGDVPELPNKEDIPVDLKSPYAVSKYSGECYCKLFYQLHNLETVCLRYFNIFGPRQDPASQYSAVIPIFITRVLKGETIIIYGDGQQTRDFCSVENVVSANILAAGNSGIEGETFNIASGNSITINELADMVMVESDKKVSIDRALMRKGEVRNSYASITKAKKLLGYKPEVNMRDGLHSTINWFRQHA